MELKTAIAYLLVLFLFYEIMMNLFYKEEVAPSLSEPTQGNIDLVPVESRWIHLFPNRSAVDVCFEEVRRQMQYLRIDTVDITVFVPQNDIGLAFVQMCEKKAFTPFYTIGQDDYLKYWFFQGDAKVKVTTLQKSQGMEARHLVLFIEDIARSANRAVLYTAFTRLRRHTNGSMLSVFALSRP